MNRSSLSKEKEQNVGTVNAMVVGMQATNRKTVYVVLVFLSLVFFFSNHYFQNYQNFAEEQYERPADFVIEKSVEGNLPRRIAFLSLGLFSLIFLRKNWLNIFDFHKPLTWVLLFFAIWSLMSLAWSVDTVLTIRKLFVFAVLCLAALAMVVSFPADFVPWCVFVVTSLYLVLGLSLETISGTFEPFSWNYRFSGTIHPNLQGINCGLMFLAAMSLSRSAERGRIFFFNAALVAFLVLILTKSRTSFVCVLIAQFIIMIKNSSKTKITLYTLGILCFFSLSYMLLDDRYISMFLKTFLLGRESDELMTLTGRTDIWELLYNYYVFQRPFQGYGFQSFWVTDHLRKLSDVTGTGISNAHSAYLDIALSIGIVGLILYVLILLLGIKNSFDYFHKTQDMGFGFFSAFFIFCLFNGLLESEFVDFSSFPSFIFIWGIFLVSFHSPVKGEEYILSDEMDHKF